MVNAPLLVKYLFKKTLRTNSYMQIFVQAQFLHGFL